MNEQLINDIVNKYLAFIDADVLKDYMFNMIEKEYNKGLEQMELQFDQNFLPNYETVSFVQNFAFQNLKGVSEEMKEALRKEVSMGLMNGESTSLLRSRIKDVLDTTIQRAEMIVRTETNRAFNMGHFQAAKDSGLNLVKEWSAQNERTSKNGNRVPCPICDSLDGKQTTIDGHFKASNGNLYLLPPVHPHCACRILYVQKNNI